MGERQNTGACSLIGIDAERLSVLVHEVRSPVAALSAVAEAARETSGAPLGRRELVRLALAASAAIQRIVADLAVASVRPEPVDVGALASDAVSALRLGGAEAEIRLGADLPLVDGDHVRLRQALDNLLANAVLHGAGGSPVVVVVWRVDTGIALSVSDSGKGMSADQLGRIFETGARLDVSTPGSGLGLPLALAIVEAHGGTLTVVSTPNAGATFTITLPGSSAHPAT